VQKRRSKSGGESPERKKVFSFWATNAARKGHEGSLSLFKDELIDMQTPAPLAAHAPSSFRPSTPPFLRHLFFPHPPRTQPTSHDCLIAPHHHSLVINTSHPILHPLPLHLTMHTALFPSTPFTITRPSQPSRPTFLLVHPFFRPVIHPPLYLHPNESHTHHTPTLHSLHLAHLRTTLTHHRHLSSRHPRHPVTPFTPNTPSDRSLL
jgi:hypothetical protein